MILMGNNDEFNHQYIIEKPLNRRTKALNT